jgi:hypothetical protein
MQAREKDSGKLRAAPAGKADSRIHEIIAANVSWR